MNYYIKNIECMKDYLISMGVWEESQGLPLPRDTRSHIVFFLLMRISELQEEVDNLQEQVDKHLASH